MKKLLFGVLICFVFFGCKKQRVTNDVLSVSQYYNVYYNVTTDETEFKANFSHPSSGTILPSGYTVTVNDSTMDRLLSTGTSYYYSRRDSGNLNAFFRLRRADGTILNNLIPVNTVPLINFTTTHATISMSDTLSVGFNSDSLHSSESITCAISQDENHYTFQQVPVQSGDSMVVLLPTHLFNLTPGPATLRLSRTSAILQLLNTDDEGSGHMRATVYAEQQVTITQ